jgi:hypothetical protein
MNQVDILFGGTRKFSYVSITDCELLWVSKKNFTKIFINEFTSVGHEIYRNALRRRVHTFQAFREAVFHCKKILKENKKNIKSPKNEDILQGFPVNEDKFHVQELSKEDMTRLIKLHEVFYIFKNFGLIFFLSNLKRISRPRKKLYLKIMSNPM